MLNANLIQKKGKPETFKKLHRQLAMAFNSKNFLVSDCL